MLLIKKNAFNKYFKKCQLKEKKWKFNFLASLVVLDTKVLRHNNLCVTRFNYRQNIYVYIYI